MEKESIEQTNQLDGDVEPQDEDPLAKETRQLHRLFKRQGDKVSFVTTGIAKYHNNAISLKI